MIARKPLSLIVLAVLVVLFQYCSAQNLVVNQVSSSLLRATIGNEITVAIDSSYLPTFGYALLSNSTTAGSGSGSSTGGNSFGNLKDARRMPRANMQSSVSGAYTGTLANLMMVFQLQHIWELRSNGMDWENSIVGSDDQLANSISQFDLSVDNKTGNIVSVNPDVVPFTLNSKNNLLTYNGAISRSNLINAFNGAVSFANNNGNNFIGDNDNDADDNVNAAVSASTSTGGSNSNANVATSKKREAKQSVNGNGNGNVLRPVLSLNTVMNQSFIATANLNPATRYIAHCYKASVLDLNNGNEQNAFVITPQSQLLAQQQSAASGSAGANAGFNTGSSFSAGSSGINLNTGSNIGASAGSSSSSSALSFLGGTNNSMIAFISPLFSSAFNEFAYVRAIPQNINMADNPLGGTLVTVQRGNLDTSLVCVIIPRNNEASFIYNLELGFVNSNNVVGAAINSAVTATSSISYMLLVGLFIVLANML